MCVCVTHTYYYIIISHNIFNFTKDGLLLLLKAKEFWQTLIQLEREINKVRYSLKFYPALSGAQAHGFALLGQIWKEIVVIISILESTRRDVTTGFVLAICGRRNFPIEIPRSTAIRVLSWRCSGHQGNRNVSKVANSWYLIQLDRQCSLRLTWRF